MRRLGRLVVLIELVVTSVLGASAHAMVAEKGSNTDKAILAAAALRADDVPSGWISGRQTDPTSRQLRDVAACKSIKRAVDASKRAPHALSGQFRDPAGLTIAENRVIAFRTAKAASGYLRAYARADAASCLRVVFAREFSEGVQVRGTPAVSAVTDFQDVGDENVAYEIAISVTAQGEDIALYVDMVLVRAGRAMVTFLFNNSNERIPAGPAIVRSVLSRLAAVPQ